MPTESTSNRAIAIAGIVTVSASLMIVSALNATQKKADANEITNVEQSVMIRQILQVQSEGKAATEKLTTAINELTVQIAQLPKP